MIIRTITGDIAPETLGRTNYHEHAFQITPLLAGDELNDLDKSSAEFSRLKASGFDAYVDATPIGLGRDLKSILELQKRTGLNIVHTTGVHRSAHYAPNSEILSKSEGELTKLFKSEITDGMLDGSGKPTPLKAGLIKFGIEKDGITGFEERALLAAATGAKDLGVGVMVHIESGSQAHDVLDKLEANGCPTTRVALAHMDRKPESSLHIELASRGAFVGHDGAGRTKYFEDKVLVKLFSEIVSTGFGSQILLGADVARASRYVEYGGGPGLEYLGLKFIPELIKATDEKTVNQVLTKNPQKWLAFNA